MHAQPVADGAARPAEAARDARDVAAALAQQAGIDLTVKLPERIYLFEFKVVADEPEGAALAQLRAKGYAEKYRGKGLPVHLVGIEFSKRQRNVVAVDAVTQ